MIACLGETTGLPALEAIHRTMSASEEGSRILAAKPRINSRSIDLNALDHLPENTFGYHYKQFLVKNVIVFPFSQFHIFYFMFVSVSVECDAR